MKKQSRDQINAVVQSTSTKHNQDNAVAQSAAQYKAAWQLLKTFSGCTSRTNKFYFKSKDQMINTQGAKKISMINTKDNTQQEDWDGPNQNRWDYRKEEQNKTDHFDTNKTNH